MFAIWKYDLYPHCLGAVVTKTNERGQAFAPSYSGWFTPVELFVDDEEGKAKYEEILALSREYEAELKAMKEKYRDRLKAVFPKAL